MTEYKMTDEMRKLLTEKLLEECWHNYVINGNKLSKCSCGMTGCNVQEVCAKENCTFTTDLDMLAVFRKIRDIKKLRDFLVYVMDGIGSDIEDWDELMCWLFLDNPERACCLAAMFLKEQK